MSKSTDSILTWLKTYEEKREEREKQREKRQEEMHKEKMSLFERLLQKI